MLTSAPACPHRAHQPRYNAEHVQIARHHFAFSKGGRGHVLCLALMTAGPGEGDLDNCLGVRVGEHFRGVASALLGAVDAVDACLPRELARDVQEELGPEGTCKLCFPVDGGRDRLVALLGLEPGLWHGSRESRDCDLD